MKNQKLYLALFFCFINFSLFAQINIGLKVGTNFSTTNGPTESVNEIKIESFDFGMGYQFGVQMRYALNEKMGLHTELNFERRLGLQKIEANYADIFADYGIIGNLNLRRETKLTYINLPLLASYSIDKISIYAGPNVAYLIGAKAEIFNDIYHGPWVSLITEYYELDYINMPFFKENGPAYHRLELGLNLGLTYRLPNDLFIDFRINHGITDMTNKQYDYSAISSDVVRDDQDRNLNFQLSISSWILKN